MNRWFRVLIYTALGIVMVTLLAVVGLVAGGPILARNLVETYIRDTTGREFEIEGRFEPVWGRHFGITAENLRLGNAPWAAEPQMATVGRLRIVLDLWSLVDRPVQLEVLELENAILNLEEGDDHVANWIFRVQRRQADRASDRAGPDFIIGQISVADTTIRYRGPNLDRQLVVAIASLNQTLREDGLLDTALLGSVNDLGLGLNGKLGPFNNLFSGVDITYELDGHLGDSVIRLAGAIDDLSNPRQPKVNLFLKGPDIGDLSDRLGLGRVGEGAFELTASLAPEGDMNRLQVDGLLGRLRVDITGSIRDIPQLDGFDLDADIAGPHLGRVLRVFGLHGPDDPFVLRTNLMRDGQEFRIGEAMLRIGDAAFNASGALSRFPTLDDAQLDLRVKGSDVEKFRELLQIPGIASGPFEVAGSVSVNAQGIEQITLVARTSLGRMKIEGTLGDPETYLGTALDVEMLGDSLAKLGDAAGISNLPEDNFSLSGLLDFAVADQLEWRKLVLTIGDNRVELNGSVSLENQAAGTDLQVVGAGNNLAQMLAIAGVTNGIPAESYEIQGRLRITEDRFVVDDVDGRVGDVLLQGSGVIGRAEALVGTNLQLRLSGPDPHVIVVAPMARKYVPAEVFDVTGRLKVIDTGYVFENVSVAIADASFHGNGFLSITPDFQDSELEISGSGPDLTQVFPDLPNYSLVPGAFEIDGRVRRGENSLLLDNVRLEFGGAKGRIDADLGLPIGTARGRFDAELRGPDASVLPRFAGFVPDALPFLVQAEGNWRADRWNFDTVMLKLGDAHAELNGTISGVPDTPAADMELTVSVPSLARLGTLNDRRPIDQPLELFIDLKDDTRILEVRTLTARLGDSDLSGQLTFRPGDVPDLELDLRSSRFYPPRLFAPEAEMDAEEPDAQEQRDRLIPDMKLPLAELRKLNARASFEATKLYLPAGIWGNLRLHAELSDGALRIDTAEVEGVEGSMSASFALVPVDASANLTLELAIVDMNTGVLSENAEDLQLLPNISGHAKLSSSGPGLRELAANLSGNGWIASSDGRVPNDRLGGLLYGDFVGELLSTINPFAKEESYTDVVCVAIPYMVTNGVLVSQPSFVAQTSKINVFSQGEIDLNTEQLDFGFETHPRKGIGISAGQLINPFIKVVGTLSEPRLTLDPAGTLVTGGAAIATAGLSLIAKMAWDRISRAGDPCGEVMQEYETQFPRTFR